jgi:ATPase subunit of ABC transporter with duplicated ATPase domains
VPALARALMCPSDLLAPFDEPTNHLDLDALSGWKFGFKRYQGHHAGYQP